MAHRMGTRLLLALGACWALATAAAAQTEGDLHTLAPFFQSGRWLVGGAIVGGLIGAAIGHFQRHAGSNRVAFGAAGGLAGGTIGGFLGSIFGWSADAFAGGGGMQTLLGLLGAVALGALGGYQASRYDQRVHEDIVAIEDAYEPPRAGLRPEHVDEAGQPLD